MKYFDKSHYILTSLSTLFLFIKCTMTSSSSRQWTQQKQIDCVFSFSVCRREFVRVFLISIFFFFSYIMSFFFFLSLTLLSISKCPPFRQANAVSFSLEESVCRLTICLSAPFLHIVTSSAVNSLLLSFYIRIHFRTGSNSPSLTLLFCLSLHPFTYLSFSLPLPFCKF